MLKEPNAPKAVAARVPPLRKLHMAAKTWAIPPTMNTAGRANSMSVGNGRQGPYPEIWPLTMGCRRRLPLPRSATVHDVAVDSPLPGLALPDEDVLALVGDVVVARVQPVAPHLIGQVARALHFERFDAEGGQPRVKDPLPDLLDRLPSPCDIGVGRQHGALLGVEAGATGGIPLPKRVDELAGGRPPGRPHPDPLLPGWQAIPPRYRAAGHS